MSQRREPNERLWLMGLAEDDSATLEPVAVKLSKIREDF
jgi:hypothetical protein